MSLEDEESSKTNPGKRSEKSGDVGTLVAEYVPRNDDLNRMVMSEGDFFTSSSHPQHAGV